MFYANLPRRRSLTWWTHTVWLCAFAFVLELVIGLGMACRFNATQPGQTFVTTPFLILLPYFAIAFWMWAACCLQSFPGFLKTLVIFLVALTAIGITAWDVNLCYKSREPITWLYLQNWPLAILSGLSILLFHGSGTGVGSENRWERSHEFVHPTPLQTDSIPTGIRNRHPAVFFCVALINPHLATGYPTLILFVGLILTHLMGLPSLLNQTLFPITDRQAAWIPMATWGLLSLCGAVGLMLGQGLGIIMGSFSFDDSFSLSISTFPFTLFLLFLLWRFLIVVPGFTLFITYFYLFKNDIVMAMQISPILTDLCLVTWPLWIGGTIFLIWEAPQQMATLRRWNTRKPKLSWELRLILPEPTGLFTAAGPPSGRTVSCISQSSFFWGSLRSTFCEMIFRLGHPSSTTCFLESSACSSPCFWLFFPC
jgi:hypothetical protein